MSKSFWSGSAVALRRFVKRRGFGGTRAATPAYTGLEQLEPRQMLAYTPTGNNFLVSPHLASLNFISQSVVATDDDGDLVVVTGAPESGSLIEIHIYPPAGGEGKAFTLNDGANSPLDLTTEGRGRDIAVAMNGDGNIVVVWDSSKGIFARRLDKTGTSAGDPFVVVPSGTQAYHPGVSVAMDSAGDFVVGYAGYFLSYTEADAVTVSAKNKVGLPIPMSGSRTSARARSRSARTVRSCSSAPASRRITPLDRAAVTHRRSRWSAAATSFSRSA